MLSRHSFTQFLRRGAAPAGTTTKTTTTMTMTPILATSRRIPPFTGQAVGTRFLHIEKRIEELGFQLPPPAPPRANYNSVCWSSGDTVLYLSGHLPFNTAGTELTKGRIGEGGRDVEYGYQAARQVALGLVATLKDQLGDLDRVEQIVKVSLGKGGCVPCLLAQAASDYSDCFFLVYLKNIECSFANSFMPQIGVRNCPIGG